MLDETLVKVDDVDLVWPVVKPMLQRAIEYNDGDFDSNFVLSRLLDSTMQLFVGYNPKEIIYAAVTEILPYQKVKALRIVLMGGKDIDSWVDTTIFERFARSQNCARIEIVGRKGWIKKLETRGYKQTHYIVTKEVKDE
jgi:hypothetical protein